MHYADRIKVIRCANRVNQEPRWTPRWLRGPRIDAYSSQRELCDWLEWCDPDGGHRDSVQRVEGFTPYTLDEAWEAMHALLTDAITEEA